MKRHLGLAVVVWTLTLGFTTFTHGVGPFFENERAPGNRVEGPAPDFRLPGQNLPPPAASAERVQGEVLKIEGEYYVVRDAAGNDVRLHIDKDTKMEIVPQVGDKIEAQMTTGGHTRAIWPTNIAAR
jgi:hypothetical protein